MEEVVELDGGLVGSVRKVLVHAAGVEVPHRRAGHDIHARRTEEEEIDGGVGLFHKSSLLVALEAGGARPRSQHLLHDELARKGQHDGVKGHKGNVPLPLAILDRLGRIILRQWVRQEDEVVQGIRLGRVESVAGEEDAEDGQGQHPSMFDAGLAHAREQTTSATTFGQSLADDGVAVGDGGRRRRRRRRNRLLGCCGVVLLKTDLARSKCRSASIACANVAAQSA